MSEPNCFCGHTHDEHGNDPECPGSTGCNVIECDCIAYEADEDSPNEAEGQTP